LKAYFARPVTHYGEIFDDLVVHQLKLAGFEVVDPSMPEFQKAYKERGMSVFTDAVAECDIVFYKSFFDGRLGAGVVKELLAAVDAGIPSMELADGWRTQGWGERELTIPQTRERVARGEV